MHGPWPKPLAGTHGKPVELTVKPADPSLVHARRGFPMAPAPAEDDKDEDVKAGDVKAEDVKAGDVKAEDAQGRGEGRRPDSFRIRSCLRRGTGLPGW